VGSAAVSVGVWFVAFFSSLSLLFIFFFFSFYYYLFITLKKINIIIINTYKAKKNKRTTT